MLIQVGAWLANRKSHKYVILTGLVCMLMISILFLYVDYFEITAGRSLHNLSNSTGNLGTSIVVVGVLTLAGLFLLAWFALYHSLNPPRSLDRIPVPLATEYSNMQERSVAGNADVMGNNATITQQHTVLEASFEDLPELDTISGETVGEHMAELAALYEQYENKEAMCRQLLGKVLTAQEEERTRLARELHDTIGQSLTAIIMTTAAIEKQLPPDYVRGKDQLVNVRIVAKQALKDLRNLIFDLRPDMLDDLGLALAVRNQAQNYLEAAGIQVRFRMAVKDQLPPEVEITVFRVVQEAITNIFRHSQATRALISLTKKNSRLIIRVEDNGIGFDPTAISNKQQQTWGLDGMKERITLLDGKFYIGARPGSGTLVLAEVPLDQK